ncbi:MAG TPA: ABATE domain-containing protein [Terracidiphilus sp.]|jgi:predicted RNA-binding Zn ribbon-like protein|nr:ABATE domain-containing protein [Terracidiphilus sp.]
MVVGTRGREFQLFGGHPALDLVNTLDWRFRAEGPEELLATYGDLVSFAEQSKLLTAKEAKRLEKPGLDEADAERALKEVRGLREALSDVLYARLDGKKPFQASIDLLEQVFKEARSMQNLRCSSDGVRWEWPAAENEHELVLLKLAQSAEELLTTETLADLRACAKPDCRWLFVDTSKNHTRRWCDMKLCGNQMKARRFKALHTEE